MKDFKYIYRNPDGTLSYTFKFEQTFGQDKLIQYIVKKLLTKKNSNLYSPTDGTPLADIIATRALTEEFKVQFIEIVNNLKNEILDIQNVRVLEGISLTSSEMLQDLRVTSFNYNKFTGVWEISLELITGTGTINFRI